MRRKTLTRHAPQLGADASLSAEDAAKRTPAHVAAFNGVGAACKCCSSGKIQQGMGDRNAYIPRRSIAAHAWRQCARW